MKNIIALKEKKCYLENGEIFFEESYKLFEKKISYNFSLLFRGRLIMHNLSMPITFNFKFKYS